MDDLVAAVREIAAELDAPDAAAPVPAPASAVDDVPVPVPALATATEPVTVAVTADADGANPFTAGATARADAPAASATSAAGASGTTMGEVAPAKREAKPLLTEDMVVRFLESIVRLDPKNRPYTSYVIAVQSRDDGEEHLRIEKRYSAFVQLDEKLRKEMPHLVAKIGRLPEKSIFKRLSPAVVDARKQALQQYLQNIIIYSPNWPGLTAFLASDIKPAQPVGSKSQTRFGGQKEGFLSKRGRTLRVWKPRYFVFRGGNLKYYRSANDDGDPSGELSLQNATVEPLPDNEVEAMRHAFLLVNDGVRHVYCAENDSERDDWVRVLGMHIEMMQPVWDDEADEAQAADAGAPAAGSAGSAAGPLSDDDEADEPPSNVLRAGVLTYKAGLLMGWKPRLCELHENGDFAFFKTDRKDVDEKPVAIISLHSYAFDVAPDTLDHKHAISLSPAPPATGPRHMFSAAGVEDREAWLAAMARFKKAVDPSAANTPKKAVRSRFNWTKKGATGAGSSSTDVGATTSDASLLAADASSPTAVEEGGEGAQSADGKHAAADDQGKLIFGSTLQRSFELSPGPNALNVPTVVFRCIEYIEAKGIEEEGVYRLSGSAAEIKELRDRFNRGEDVALVELRMDLNVVAGLLKQYLREILNPVLTNELRMAFFDTSSIEDKEERIAKIARLLTLLPPVNRDLLKALMAHLTKVQQHEDRNKMTVRNLGIVFSPTLQIPAGVFTLFLTEYDRIFLRTEETAALDASSAAVIDQDDDLATPPEAPPAPALLVGPSAVDAPAAPVDGVRADAPSEVAA